jgi:hypothetical protein
MGSILIDNPDATFQTLMRYAPGFYLGMGHSLNGNGSWIRPGAAMAPPRA